MPSVHSSAPPFPRRMTTAPDAPVAWPAQGRSGRGTWSPGSAAGTPPRRTHAAFQAGQPATAARQPDSCARRGGSRGDGQAAQERPRQGVLCSNARSRNAARPTLPPIQHSPPEYEKGLLREALSPGCSDVPFAALQALLGQSERLLQDGPGSPLKRQASRFPRFKGAAQFAEQQRYEPRSCTPWSRMCWGFWCALACGS